MGENAGFARAVNAGWRAASSEWIAILNSDVELAPDWAERLIAGAGDAGFATGLILNASNRDAIDGTYDLMSRAACAWRAGYGEASRREPSPSRSRQSPSRLAPPAFFAAKSCLRMNGFDESFGSYLEDVDLGLRCLREGISGAFVPDASRGITAAPRSAAGIR